MFHAELLTEKNGSEYLIFPAVDYTYLTFSSGTLIYFTFLLDGQNVYSEIQVGGYILEQ